MSLAAGLVRLVHPFPSLLDGLATLGIALLAGGSPGVALRLAAAMVCLQAAIGALNDVVDARRDAGHKPSKPIPAGAVTPGQGRAVAGGAAVAGLLLSLPSGLPTTAVAVGILVVGLLYDLRLRGTAWSWAPFAIGIPLLPVYAWLGAVGRLPALFAVLTPAAVAAGAALAIANALVDVERDRAGGSTSVADRLGSGTAWALHAVLHAIVGAVALASLVGAGASAVALLAAAGAAALIGVGVALVGGAVPGRRERGWEFEAIGVAAVAIAWIAGFGPVSG